jgi:hypothetical protein
MNHRGPHRMLPNINKLHRPATGCVSSWFYHPLLHNSLHRHNQPSRYPRYLQLHPQPQKTTATNTTPTQRWQTALKGKTVEMKSAQISLAALAYSSNGHRNPLPSPVTRRTSFPHVMDTLIIQRSKCSSERGTRCACAMDLNSIQILEFQNTEGI